MKTIRRLAFLAALAGALGMDGPPPPGDARALAPKVTDYPTKFRLIELGRPAVEPLFEQVEASDRRVAFESRSALRWIAARASEQPDEALAIADLVVGYTRAERPRSVRAFAAELLGEIGVESTIPALAALLADEAVRDPALGSLARMKSARAGEAIVARLSAAPAAFKGEMLLALGRRREPRVTPALVGATRSAATRLAAIEAIGLSGDPEGAPALVAILEGGGASDEKRAAHSALLDVARVAPRAGDAERLLLAALRGASDETERAAALEGLAHRGAGESSLPAVEQAMRSANEEVRSRALRAAVSVADGRLHRGDPRGAEALYRRVLDAAADEIALVHALAGLSRAGGEGVVAAVAGFLRNDSRVVREASVAALSDLPGERATQALTSALEGPSRPLVLDALGRRRDAAAIPAVSRLAEALDPDAIRALGAIGDRRAAPVLLHALLRGETSAMDAYLRVAEVEAAERPEAAQALYLDLVKAGKPSVAVLSALARVAGGESIPEIDRLVEAGPEELRPAAVECLVAVADRLAARGENAEALRLYHRALDGPAAGAASLEGKIRSLGEPIEITARDGRIEHWWVIGPFAAPDASVWEEPHFPEQGVDLAAGHRIGEREVRWKPLGTTGEPPRIDLARALDPHDHVAAYAYCELICRRERAVTFSCGSDDGIIVWLNGQRVHSFLEPRGLKPDQDTFQATVKEGSNTVLVKVLQGVGGWGFCVRVLDEEGLPLKFKVR